MNYNANPSHYMNPELPFVARPGQPEDAPAIADLHSELADYCGYPPERFRITPQHVRHAIESDEQVHYYVVDAEPNDSNRLAAMTQLVRIPLSWSGVSGVYVEDLVVGKQYRHGRGLGRLLLAQACQLAIELANNDPEAAFLRLDTSLKDNEATLGFYRSLNMDGGNLNFRLYGRAVARLAATYS